MKAVNYVKVWQKTTIQNQGFSAHLKNNNNLKINPQQNTNTKYTPHKPKNTSYPPNPLHTTKNNSLTQK